MKTLQKIKDFCQDEINEFSVLGYEPSKYQLGYNSAINDIKDIYEEIPDNSHQIEKLESDKAELLERIEIYKECFELYIDPRVWDESTEFLSTAKSGLAKELKKKI